MYLIMNFTSQNEGTRWLVVLWRVMTLVIRQSILFGHFWVCCRGLSDNSQAIRWNSKRWLTLCLCAIIHGGSLLTGIDTRCGMLSKLKPIYIVGVFTIGVIKMRIGLVRSRVSLALKIQAAHPPTYEEKHHDHKNVDSNKDNKANQKGRCHDQWANEIT